jgi:hypothetical protein
MRLHSIPVLAGLVWLTAASLATAADSAGDVIIDNKLPLHVRIDAESYIDADGKRLPLNGYWLIAPNQSATLLFNSVKLKGRQFNFKLSTVDGQSRDWSFASLKEGALRCELNAASLAIHRQRIADDRKTNKADSGTLQILVPEGAVVSLGDWKPLVVRGATILNNIAPLKPGQVASSTIKIEYVVDGKTYSEEGTFCIEAGTGSEWDCRDMVTPDKLARTARYVTTCRGIIRRNLDRLTDKASLAEQGAAYVSIAQQIDGLPVRGVDEDAVKLNLYVAERFSQIGADLKKGTASKADVDTLLADLNSRSGRIRKTLEARYGDRYTDALANGGKATPVVTTFKPSVTSNPPPPPPPPPPAINREKEEKRQRYQADLNSARSSVTYYQKQLNDLAPALLIARGTLATAAAAYDRATNLGDQIAAGIILAGAKGAVEEFERDKQRFENGLREAQERIRRLQQSLDELDR